jgi:hypothetical protein
MMAVFFLIVTPLAGIYIWWGRRSGKKGRGKAIIKNTLQKIVLSGFQVNGMALAMQFNLDDYVLNVLSYAQDASSVATSQLAMECESFGDIEMRRPVFQRAFLFLVLPLCIFVIAGCDVAVFYAYRYVNKQKATCGEVKSIFVNFVIVLGFLIHPSIVAAVCDNFSFVQLGQNTAFMSMDHSEMYWSDNHRQNTFRFTLPTFLFWVVGLPAVLMFYLWLHRHHLDKESFWKKAHLLYDGYKREYYWWEGIVTARKVALISAVVLGNLRQTRSALTLIVIFFAALLHENQRPFALPFLHWAESASLLCTFLVFFCGMVSQHEDVPVEARATVINACSVVAISVLVAFTVFALVLYIKVCSLPDVDEVSQVDTHNFCSCFCCKSSNTHEMEQVPAPHMVDVAPTRLKKTSAWKSGFVNRRKKSSRYEADTKVGHIRDLSDTTMLVRGESIYEGNQQAKSEVPIFKLFSPSSCAKDEL